MKKMIIASALFMTCFVACNKENADDVSLSASETSVAVNQTVTFTAISDNANTFSWSVTPEVNSSKTYSITTEKINEITFSQPGTYEVCVKGKKMGLDSIHHCNKNNPLQHHADSTWNKNINDKWHQNGHHKSGHRKKGKETDCITITII